MVAAKSGGASPGSRKACLAGLLPFEPDGKFTPVCQGWAMISAGVCMEGGVGSASGRLVGWISPVMLQIYSLRRVAPGPIYQLGVADATALSATRSMRVMACLRQLRTDLQESAWKAIHEVGDL